MPLLDVFRGDAYGVVSLTNAINKLPYKPSKLKEMGLFKESGVRTTSIVVEEKNGILYLVPATARGTSTKVVGERKRKIRSFVVPHLALEASVMADDVQNIRAFGSENDVEAIDDLINDKLSVMRQSMEYTHEWHRIGAIQGQVLDADGSSVLFDWFEEFGIDEETVNFDFTESNAVKLAAHSVKRHIEDALGMTPYDKIVGICGSEFFDALSTCDEVKDAYNRWKDGAFLRAGQARGEFEYADITFMEYRGKYGSTPFIADNVCRFFPLGAPDVFTTSYAPADYVETVNTIGKPIYAKQEPMRMNKGIDIEVQSNPIFVCTRPAVLVKGLMTGS